MTLWLLNYFALQVFSIETSCAYPQKKPLFLGVGRAGEGTMRRAQNPSVPKLSIPKHPKKKKEKKEIYLVWHFPRKVNLDITTP